MREEIKDQTEQPDVMTTDYIMCQLTNTHPEYCRWVSDPDDDPSTTVWIVDREGQDPIYDWPWGGTSLCNFPRAASELPEGWVADDVIDAVRPGWDYHAEPQSPQQDLVKPGARGPVVRILYRVHPVDVSWEEWVAIRDTARHDYMRLLAAVRQRATTP